MSVFPEGDKVRDRHTGAEGIVTVYSEEGVTVEWLDVLRRLCTHTFNERRLLLVETAAARAAAEGTRVERRAPKDEPERELRITAPMPADGGVAVTVPGEVLESLDERVEAERQRREETAEAIGEQLVDEAIETPAGAEPELEEDHYIADGEGPEPPT